jgi:hypothetical protein
MRGGIRYLGLVTTADPGGAGKPERRVVGEARVLGTVVVLAVALVLGATGARRPAPPAPLTLVNMAGDAALLTDPNLPQELTANGLQVTQHRMGSRAVATDPKLATYDIASVSSDDAAAQVQQRLKDAGVVESTKLSPTGTPMVVLTYQPIADLLKALGVASRGADGIWHFDMRAYVGVVAAKKRWTDITVNGAGNTTYPSSNQILLETTDPAESGSGGLFLMLLSYLLNGDAPVTDKATADRLLPRILPFYLDQGDMPVHTPDLLDGFLTGGMDRYPMIFEYEGDYLAQLINQPGTLPRDLVVMYPSPTVFAEQTFVSWTPAGNKLNYLMRDDPVLVKAEIDSGQRTRGHLGEFVRAMAARGVTVPGQLTEVTPPSDAVLDYMIERIDSARQQAGSN